MNTQQTTAPSEPLNLGVYIDGAWWYHLTHYWLHHHQMRVRLNLEGVIEAARWHTAVVFDQPVERVARPQAHFFMSRRDGGGPAGFFAVLDRLYIQRHTLPFDERRNREVGVDVKYALTCWRTAADLDMVFLITGDDDHEPLVGDLVHEKRSVLIPRIDVKWTDARTGRERWLAASPRLCDAATDSPTWDDLLAVSHTPGYPLVSPFLHQPDRPASRPGARTPAVRRRP